MTAASKLAGIVARRVASKAVVGSAVVHGSLSRAWCLDVPLMIAFACGGRMGLKKGHGQNG